MLGIVLGIGGLLNAEFDCENGESIRWVKMLDGNIDCADGSDEETDGDFTMVYWMIVLPGSISLASHYLGIRFQDRATRKNQLLFNDEKRLINQEFNRMYKKGIDEYRLIDKQIGQLRRKIGMINAADNEIGKGLKFQEEGEEKIVEFRAEIAAIKAQEVEAEKERESMEEEILKKFSEIKEFIPISEYLELSI